MFNWVAFAVNTVFHLIHLLNTHTTYDGLAQDTTICSSMGRQLNSAKNVQVKNGGFKRSPKHEIREMIKNYAVLNY